MLCFCHDTSEGEVGFVGVIADCGELRGCWGGVNQPAFRLILPRYPHIPATPISQSGQSLAAHVAVHPADVNVNTRHPPEVWSDPGAKSRLRAGLLTINLDWKSMMRGS